MRKLAILTFQSLDGVMQAPSEPSEDYSGGFIQGGWAKRYWDEVMEQVGREAISEPYDLLLGRKTYELFSKHNSGIDSPLNEMIKYVTTNTLSELEWKNSIIVSGEIAKEVAKLKEQDGPLLQVHGSWALIQELMRHNLVDEFRLWTFPVIVGSGKKTFSEERTAASLSLIKSAVTTHGVSMAFYQKEK